MEEMKRLGVWLQPVSHWLVAWLISQWGSVVVMIGTLALAGSVSLYLTSAADHPAPTGVSGPDAVTSIPTHCTLSLLVVAPDIACDDR
jgi:hypothetical protein